MTLKTLQKWIRTAGLFGLGALMFSLVLVVAVIQSLPDLVRQGYVDPKDWQKRPPLETQLEETLRALDTNSKDAMTLLEKLRTEVGNRISLMQDSEKRLAALREQRALLELTPQQRAGIESLTRRPPSLWGILVSWEFALNVLVNVVIAAIFYGLGRRHSPARREANDHQGDLDARSQRHRRGPEAPETGKGRCGG